MLFDYQFLGGGDDNNTTTGSISGCIRGYLYPSSYKGPVKRYDKLIYQKASADQNECLVLPTEGRPAIRFRRKAILAYRFTYAIAMVLPLSEVDLIRHECNYKRCINPRHLMTGDHRENMTDLEAEQAYGTRWDLLKRSTDRF